MSDKEIPDYVVVRNPEHNENGILAGFDYFVRYDADISSGSGGLEFKKARTYPIVMNYFPDLKGSDELADITRFYPHDKIDIRKENFLELYKERLERFGRHGIGTDLLMQMITDSKGQGCDVMYISSNRRKLISLLRKNGFISDTIVGVDHFRLL